MSTRYGVSRHTEGGWAELAFRTGEKAAMREALRQAEVSGTVRVYAWPKRVEDLPVLRIQRDGRCYGPWAARARELRAEEAA